MALWIFEKAAQGNATSKPSKLESSRARNTTSEAVNAYFTNLKMVMQENNLENKPYFIYSLDENGIQPEHRPSNIIGNPNFKPQAITSPKSSNTAVIGCVNAAGFHRISFSKGKNGMKSCWKGHALEQKEQCQKVAGVTAQYLNNIWKSISCLMCLPQIQNSRFHWFMTAMHLTKVLRQLSLRGKKSIILFVLPAHSSHILQPLDVSIFGPFKNYYYSECSNFMQRNMGHTITKYEICTLACKAYLKAMTPRSIQNGFRKTGLFPLKAITQEKFFPLWIFQGEKSNR